jgi:protein arginine kinase
MSSSSSGSYSLGKWIEGKGPYQDVAVSSRIRLARNLKGYSFPGRMNGEEQKEVVEKIDAVLSKPAVEAKLGKLRTIWLQDLPAIQRQVFVEQHVISPQHARVIGDSAKAVILRDDQAIAIMVNEEDHLRIQAFMPGLQLEETYRMASEVDNTIEVFLPLAFHDKYGYLTSCPTNAGTGLRASVMVHLPALTMTQQTNNVLMALSKVGLAIRGSYGEGTEAYGNLFQISNQITLGRTEEGIIQDLSRLTKKVIEQERTSRDLLMEGKETGVRLKDRIYRSLGILSNARIISTSEALSLLSDLRMGIDIGLVPDIDAKTINKLMVLIRPAYVEYIVGQNLSSEERDIARADLIRRSLKNEVEPYGGGF